MLSKYFCIKDRCLRVYDINRNNLLAGNCVKKCQFNRAKSPEVKDNSRKLSKKKNNNNNGKKRKA